MITLFVCALCKAAEPDSVVSPTTGGEVLIDRLQQYLATQGLQNLVELKPVRCMAACDRPCNAALSAPGRLTYILRDLSPTTAAPALAQFCQQYAACAGGRVPYGLRGATIHGATAYVLPPLAALAS